MLKYFPTDHFGFYSDFKNFNLEEDHRRDVNRLKKKHTAPPHKRIQENFLTYNVHYVKLNKYKNNFYIIDQKIRFWFKFVLE
jgi:hypothetical protein